MELSYLVRACAHASSPTSANAIVLCAASMAFSLNVPLLHDGSVMTSASLMTVTVEGNETTGHIVRFDNDVFVDAGCTEPAVVRSIMDLPYEVRDSADMAEEGVLTHVSVKECPSYAVIKENLKRARAMEQVGSLDFVFLVLMQNLRKRQPVASPSIQAI